MKRIKLLSLIACVLIFSTLCACSGESYALAVDGIEIDKGIYGYYLSVAMNDPLYKEQEDKDSIANSLCAQYVAGKNLILQHGIALSASEKVSTSAQIKSKWQLYSSFYQKHSVSKEALTEIISYETLVDKLTLSVYGEGDKALSKAELEDYFYKNFVAVKIISTDFQQGSGEGLSEEEVEQITEKFTAMRNIVRSGGEMASAAEKHPELVEYDDQIKIIRSDDATYPTGMFSKTSQMQGGSAQVLRYDRGIFLVEKIDMKKEPESYFDLYRNECLLILKSGDMASEIAEASLDYEISSNQNMIAEIKSLIKRS